MSRIKGKNTKPEVSVRKALWAAGVRGYRLHPKSVPGKPDITFIGKKVAVFVHGCFWHTCPHCQPRKPQSNKVWWSEKLAKNVERDNRKEQDLGNAGWIVLTIWECEIKADLEASIQRIISVV